MGCVRIMGGCGVDLEEAREDRERGRVVGVSVAGAVGEEGGH